MKQAMMMTASAIVLCGTYTHAVEPEKQSPPMATSVKAVEAEPTPKTEAAAQPTIAAASKNSKKAVHFMPDSNGRMTVGNLECRVIHYNESWQGIDQGHNLVADKDYPSADASTWVLKGKWDTFAGQFGFEQQVEFPDSGSAVYEVKLTSDKGVKSNALGLGILLPTASYAGQQIVVDGNVVQLPKDKSTQQVSAILMNEQTAKSVEIATSSGRLIIEGSSPLLVQDNRIYGEDGYFIRWSFTPQQGLIKDATLKLDFRHIADKP